MASSVFDLLKKMDAYKAQSASAAAGPITHIVAGLGNPGSSYDGTRHNCGFLVMDALAEKHGLSITHARFGALVCEGTLGGKRVLFMKPQLLMNRSGEAIRDAAQFYKIPPENILVVFDDISLAPGRLRIKRNGSDGGHNGIKNILYHLNSDAFPRLKIGVGAPPPGTDLIPWVLGRFAPDAKEEVRKAVLNACEAIPLLLAGDIDRAMNLYNR